MRNVFPRAGAWTCAHLRHAVSGVIYAFGGFMVVSVVFPDGGQRGDVAARDFGI